MAQQWQDGQRLQGSDGNLYVVRGGVPVLENTPVPIGGYVVKRADAKDVYEAPKAQADLAKTRLDVERARRDIVNDDRRLANADADRSQSARNSSFDNANQLRSQFQGQKAVQDFAMILPQVASAMQIATNPKATGADDLSLIYTFGKVMDPGSVVREAEQAMAMSTGSFAQNLEGAVAKLQSGEKLPPDVRRNLVEAMRRRGVQLSRSYNQLRGDYQRIARENGFNPADIVGTHPATPFQQAEADFTGKKIGNLDGSTGAVPGSIVAATGGTRAAPDKKLEKIVNGMIYAGASDAEINQAVGGFNRPPLDPAQLKAAREFLAKNPRFSGGLARDEQSAPTSLLNRLSASPLGSTLAGAANGFFAGGLDEIAGGINSALSGKPLSEAIAEADQLKQLSAEANPRASFLGNLAGGGTALAVGGGLLGGTKIGSLASPLVTDVIYGGVNGALENNDNRAAGVGIGAIGGVVGNKVGGALVDRLGRFATGVLDPKVRLLDKAGVEMTGGQMLGGTAKAIEDQLTSVPGTGDAIKSLRNKSLDQANLEAMRIGGIPSGVTPTSLGAQGLRELEAGKNEAYRVLDPVNLQVDDQFKTAKAIVDQSAGRLPGEMAANAKYTLGRIDDAITDNVLTGRNFQEARKGVQQDIASVRRSNASYGHEFSAVAGEGIDAMEGLLERQAPGVLDDYLKANAANRNLMILADAVDKAGANEGRFTMNQLGQAERSNMNKFSGKLASATGEGPFYDFQQAAQAVLPSKYADSGSAGRIATMALPSILAGGAGAVAGAPFDASAQGAGIGSGVTLATLAAAGLLNSPAGRALAAKTLLSRPQWAVKAGEAAIGGVPFAQAAGRVGGTQLALDYLR